MAVTPTPDLTSVLYEKISEIQKVAERSKNLKGTYVKLINNATAMMHAAAKELSTRAQLSQTEQAEEEMTLRRETVSLRNENKYLKREMDNIRKRLRELEAGSACVPVADRILQERNPSPSPKANMGKGNNGGSGTGTPGKTAGHRITQPVQIEEEVQMDVDNGCSPHLPADEDADAVYRPSLRGNRKRLDTRPSDVGVGPLDAAEYNRITEMIAEFLDMRAPWR